MRRGLRSLTNAGERRRRREDVVGARLLDQVAARPERRALDAVAAAVGEDVVADAGDVAAAEVLPQRVGVVLLHRDDPHVDAVVRASPAAAPARTCRGGSAAASPSGAALPGRRRARRRARATSTVSSVFMGGDSIEDSQGRGRASVRARTARPPPADTGATAARCRPRTLPSATRRASACSRRAAPPRTTCPVRVAPTMAEADSQRTPSGSPRTAATAIIDEVSKIDRSCARGRVLQPRPDLGDRLARRQAGRRQAARIVADRLPLLAQRRPRRAAAC